MSDRLLFEDAFFEMSEEEEEKALLFILTELLALGAPPRGRPPDPFRATRRGAAPARRDGSAALREVSMTVFLAELFKVSLMAARGRFLPAITFDISGTNADTRFLPNSLATGKMYFVTSGIATRPIRIAKAPMPPEPNCLAGPQKVLAVDCWSRIWLS